MTPPAADRPTVIVPAGPNGAGKTSTAQWIIPRLLSLGTFVNADVIASGLSAFSPESAAIEAGRLMLRRINELAARREDFAFETTLSSRTFAPLLRRLSAEGYRVEIIYVVLDSPELAIERVRLRVAGGGHSVPDDTIRRRFYRGLSNFFELYAPIAYTWHVYDNSHGPARLIAEYREGRITIHGSAGDWQRIQDKATQQ